MQQSQKNRAWHYVAPTVLDAWHHRPFFRRSQLDQTSTPHKVVQLMACLRQKIIKRWDCHVKSSLTIWPKIFKLITHHDIAKMILVNSWGTIKSNFAKPLKQQLPARAPKCDRGTAKPQSDDFPSSEERYIIRCKITN